jgi:hypothetical protein
MDAAAWKGLFGLQVFLLMACRRHDVTADAAGRIGIFPLDLRGLLHDAADSS